MAATEETTMARPLMPPLTLDTDGTVRDKQGFEVRGADAVQDVLNSVKARVAYADFLRGMFENCPCGVRDSFCRRCRDIEAVLTANGDDVYDAR